MTSSEHFSISRRRVSIGGVGLIATVLVGGGAGAALAQPRMREPYPGVVSRGGGTKPTYLPAPNSTDPVAHSLAENLFWNEQLMEHAAFFIMLMPGPELAGPRAQAERFQAQFANQLRQSQRGLRRGDYAGFNRLAIDRVRRFAEFKQRMRDQQSRGALKSLVWPTFFDHTAREAEYFAARLEQLSRGEVDMGRRNTVDFWASIMGEHADFVAHLLDPTERALVAKAMETSEAFRRLRERPGGGRQAAARAVDEIIDFKVAAQRGIEAGQIKSIIHPTLADHVRREALKAADELARAER